MFYLAIQNNAFCKIFLKNLKNTYKTNNYYKVYEHCMRPLETAEENVMGLTGREIQLPYPELGSTDKIVINISFN